MTTQLDKDGELRNRVLELIHLAVRTEHFTKYQKNMQFLADDLVALITSQVSAQAQQARIEMTHYLADMQRCNLGDLCSNHQTHDLLEYEAALHKQSRPMKEGIK